MRRRRVRYYLRDKPHVEKYPDGTIRFTEDKAVFVRLDNGKVESRLYDRTIRGGTCDRFVKLLLFESIKAANECRNNGFKEYSIINTDGKIIDSRWDEKRC